MKKVLVAVLAVTLVMSGCSTKWVTVAQADLPILVNIASSIIAMTDPQADKDLQTYAAEIGTDLALLKGLLDEYNAAPAGAKATTQAKISTLLAEVSGHLNELLAAAHVKSGSKAAHISQAVQVAILTVTSIAALVANSKTASRLPEPQELQATLTDLESFAGTSQSQ